MRHIELVLLGLVVGLGGPHGAAWAHQAQRLRADPVLLNIGLVCQWQRPCIARQRSAMNRSLKYVAKYKPPQWRLHLCNKNSSRGAQRKDWIGFDQCVRNERLRPPPPAVEKKATKKKRG